MTLGGAALIYSLMSERSILLIIGGGVAAYKSLELIRELGRRGVRTRGVLTKAGAEFITPLSVASLTGDKCYTDLFDLTDEAEMGHIELSRSADLLVVAPATADLMAKAANGLANDLASTALLATDKPVMICAGDECAGCGSTPRPSAIFATLKGDGVMIHRSRRGRHGLRRIWAGPYGRARCHC